MHSDPTSSPSESGSGHAVPPSPLAASGEIHLMRLYDIAAEIDLDAAERAALRTGSEGPVARVRLDRTAVKAMHFGVAPVELPMGTVEVESADGVRTADAVARVYDFGVVALGLRIPVTERPWEAFVREANEWDHALGADSEARIWRLLLDRVTERIFPALERPERSPHFEEYLIARVRSHDGGGSAEAFLDRVDPVPLLSGEDRRLAPAARTELLRHRHSWYQEDLVVLGWDRALVVEPSGSRDVIDILEVANAQLLELRIHDELLDRELPRMYDRVQAARGAFRGLSRRRYADLARALHSWAAEVTEITDRVENALKVTEDVYLARVYADATDLFRLPSWTGAVRAKVANIRDTYTALYDEAATTRSELLELAIVLLIVFEIVWAFLQ